MKKPRYTEQQIAQALRQVEQGTPATEVCRKLGVSETTFYHWKKRYAEMGVAELRRVKQLEDENLKQRGMYMFRAAPPLRAMAGRGRSTRVSLSRYSITRSARCRSDGGIVRASALAVLSRLLDG